MTSQRQALTAQQVFQQQKKRCQMHCFACKEWSDDAEGVLRQGVCPDRGGCICWILRSMLVPFREGISSRENRTQL